MNSIHSTIERPFEITASITAVHVIEASINEAHTITAALNHCAYIGGGSEYMSDPSHLIETEGFFIWGWEGENLIRRQDRQTGEILDTTVDDFATAWAAL